MATSPQRPPEIDEETRRIVEARLATLDQDEKQAVDAQEFLADLRRKLTNKHPVPK